MYKTTLVKARTLPVGRFRDKALRVLFSLTATVLVGLTTGGCPTNPPDGGSGTPGTDPGTGTGTATVEVISFRNNFDISVLEVPVSVLYSVETDASSESVAVSGFYVPVADNGANAAETGDRVVIATGLETGVNRAFEFDPSVPGTGFYRVGVIVDIAGTQFVDNSSGTIQIQGPPAPRFIQPLDAITEVSPGADVLISFDAGDPEGVVQWRLFFLTETDPRTVLPSELGTQLKIGSGNVGNTTFATSGLTPGDYEIGISATDSGLSVGATVANGDLDKIVTIPATVEGGSTTVGPIIRVAETRIERPPTLAFTSPSNEAIDLFGDAVITINFDAQINEPNATGVVDIFYDDDQVFSNRIFPIGSNLPATTSTVQFDTSIIADEGTYFIGGSVRDGLNPRVVTYAGGPINLVRSGTLNILEPVVSTSLKPVGPGETAVVIPIVWETNVPEDAGTVEVFARSTAIDNNVEFPLLASSPTSVTNTEFSADLVNNQSGLYEIFVRVTFAETIDIPPLTVAAPVAIRVSSLPTVLWLGDLVSALPPFDGAIFEGIQSEDNAGSAFTRVGDLNADGFSEFVIAARYGKPFFVNPSGIGPGEAYLIFGGSSRLRGRFNLNSVGLESLMGVTFTGIRTPQGNAQTDGLASVLNVPDVDGDGRDELIFGFPSTNSRGHNVDPFQDGVVDPRSLSTLEREQQFLRGGAVIVSSTNSSLGTPTPGAASIPLDLVGQNFASTCVDIEAGDPGAFAIDMHAPINSVNPAPCTGNCLPPFGNASNDGNTSLNYGFVRALSRDFFNTYVYSFALFGGTATCPAANAFLLNNACLAEYALTNGLPALEFCREQTSSCTPSSPGLHSANLGILDRVVNDAPGFPSLIVPEYGRHSGFYESMMTDGNGAPFANDPLEPFGARIIGVGLSDLFGSSITLVGKTATSDGDLIISAPGRTARGLLRGPSGGPEAGGEISGLGNDSRTDAGVGYLFAMRDLWSPDNSFGTMILPPRPHQYIVGEPSHCEGGVPRLDNITATRIAGDTGDAITNIIGIDDFNGDGRDDFAIGAPDANSGQGRVYIAFRREPSLENDFVLEKLASDISDAERLSGELIITTNMDQLGFSLATGVDFNADGLSDLVIGSPGAGGGIGAVIIIFGDPGLITPIGGMTVQDLLSSRNANGFPRAIRITGNALDANGQFGFNVAPAGDVDNDGFVDLLVAAPNASPRFDPDPSDSIDTLTEIGVDTDLNGVADTTDDLAHAGIVYLISGINRFDLLTPDFNTGEFSISIDTLGSADLKGYMIAGRQGGDRLGGGDAGDSFAGGIDDKLGRGRSFGLSAAGDIDGDGRDDILIGSVLADPRKDQLSGTETRNGGEAYLIYSTINP